MFRLCQQALHCTNYIAALLIRAPDAKFFKSIGWADAASNRTGRYTVVIRPTERSLYADIETERSSLKWGYSMSDFHFCC